METQGIVKTRAQIYRDKVKISIAPDHEGERIEQLLLDNNVVVQSADWSKIHPWWLIATVGDDLVGCVNVVISKPMGRIEFLYVSPHAKFKVRAIAMKKLVEHAISTLDLAECGCCISTVDAINFRFYNIIEKYATKIADGAIFLKRLRIEQ